MRIRTMLSYLALSLALAGPAAAASGRYSFGLTAGEEVVGGDQRSEPVFGLPSSGDDRSYKVFFGVGLGRGLAFEAAYHDFGNRQVVPATDFGWDLDLTAWSGSLVWLLPVRRVDLFTKVGWMQWEEEGTLFTFVGPVDHRVDDSNLLYGAGVEIGLGRYFALRGEWERFDFDSGAEDALAAGVALRF